MQIKQRTSSLVAKRQRRLRMVAGCLLGNLALLNPCTSAAPPDAATRECAQLSDDAARLACYDRLYRPAPAPTPAAQRATNTVFARSTDTPVERCDKEPSDSLLDSRWELARVEPGQRGPASFCIRPYRPIYLMPFYSSDPNLLPRSPSPENTVTEPEDINHGELKYQLSLKTKIVNDLFGDNGDVWMGYTQVSHWQIFNEEKSRPFRETNYEPDVNLVFRTDFDVLGWKARMLGFGLVHQSNGRSNPLSRSWNRAFATLGLERDHWTVTVRPWWRVLEFGDDNNPDISDYMGRADVEVVHVRGDHQLALMLRHTLRGGERSRGAVQFDWAYPIKPPLRVHMQLFNGYGESLIDYNHRAWYAGIGLSLIEWY